MNSFIASASVSDVKTVRWGVRNSNSFVEVIHHEPLLENERWNPEEICFSMTVYRGNLSMAKQEQIYRFELKNSRPSNLQPLDGHNHTQLILRVEGVTKEMQEWAEGHYVEEDE